MEIVGSGMAGLPGAIGRPNVVAQGFAATLGDVLSLAFSPDASTTPALPVATATASGDSSAMAFTALAMLGHAPAAMLKPALPDPAIPTIPITLTAASGAAPTLSATIMTTPAAVLTAAPTVAAANGDILAVPATTTLAPPSPAPTPQSPNARPLPGARAASPAQPAVTIAASALIDAAPLPSPALAGANVSDTPAKPPVAEASVGFQHQAQIAIGGSVAAVAEGPAPETTNPATVTPRSPKTKSSGARLATPAPAPDPAITATPIPTALPSAVTAPVLASPDTSAPLPTPVAVEAPTTPTALPAATANAAPPSPGVSVATAASTPPVRTSDATPDASAPPPSLLTPSADNSATVTTAPAPSSSSPALPTQPAPTAPVAESAASTLDQPPASPAPAIAVQTIASLLQDTAMAATAPAVVTALTEAPTSSPTAPQASRPPRRGHVTAPAETVAASDRSTPSTTNPQAIASVPAAGALPLAATASPAPPAAPQDTPASSPNTPISRDIAPPAIVPPGAGTVPASPASASPAPVATAAPAFVPAPPDTAPVDRAATAAPATTMIPALPVTAHGPIVAPAPRTIISAQPGRIGRETGVAIAHRVSAGGDEMTLHLSPASLGRIEVKIAFEDGNLRATLRAENPAALDLLRRDSVDLSRALDQAGIRSDSGSLNFQGSGAGGQTAGSRQQSPFAPFSQRGEQRDSAPPPIPDSYQPLRTSGRVDFLA